MKNLKHLGMALLMVMLAINLVACGDDKEDGDKEITPSIVGTWKLTVDKGYTHTHVTFTKDGTFSYTSTDWIMRNMGLTR